MVTILGYNAWKDVNCFDIAATSNIVDNITLQNFNIQSVNLVSDIDERYQIETPMYDAGYTLINSKFEGIVYSSALRSDYKDINKIVIYRWIDADEDWAMIKEYILSSESWEDVDLTVLRTLTKDTAFTTSIIKYKIEYYKWNNQASVLDIANIKYLELEYRLQSNFISDKDECFPLLINVNISEERVQDVGMVQTMGNRYPIVIKNSMTNYNQGSFSAMLMTSDILEQLRSGGGYGVDESLMMKDFKKRIIDFLTNGKPKCIRTIQGEMFIVNITGNVSVQWLNFGSGYQCSISFNWVEIADSSSAEAIERMSLTYN